MGIFRRSSLSSDQRAALGLHSGEKVLATTANGDEGALVATTRALTVLDSAPSIAEQWQWSAIDRAQWDLSQAVLAVYLAGENKPRLLGPIDATNRKFLLTVRERIDASIVSIDTVDLADDAHVNAIIRRGEDGLLFSQVVVHGTVDLDDADISQRIEAAESKARSNVGLEP